MIEQFDHTDPPRRVVVGRRQGDALEFARHHASAMLSRSHGSSLSVLMRVLMRSAPSVVWGTQSFRVGSRAPPAAAYPRGSPMQRLQATDHLARWSATTGPVMSVRWGPPKRCRRQHLRHPSLRPGRTWSTRRGQQQRREPHGRDAVGVLAVPVLSGSSAVRGSSVVHGCSGRPLAAPAGRGGAVDPCQSSSSAPS